MIDFLTSLAIRARPAAPAVWPLQRDERWTDEQAGAVSPEAAAEALAELADDAPVEMIANASRPPRAQESRVPASQHRPGGSATAAWPATCDAPSRSQLPAIAETPMRRLAPVPGEAPAEADRPDDDRPDVSLEAAPLDVVRVRVDRSASGFAQQFERRGAVKRSPPNGRIAQPPRSAEASSAIAASPTEPIASSDRRSRRPTATNGGGILDRTPPAAVAPSSEPGNGPVATAAVPASATPPVVADVGLLVRGNRLTQPAATRPQIDQTQANSPQAMPLQATRPRTTAIDPARRANDSPQPDYAVQVSIGSVEVRSAAPPPSSRPAAADPETPRPLKLEEYLRRSRRGDRP